MEVKVRKANKIGTCEELREALAGYYCTEQYHYLPYHFPRMNYTDGVKAMARKVGAYWLLDLIQSHFTKVMATDSLSRFALVRLESKEDGSAEFTIREDSHFQPVVRQSIAITDFPVGTFEMYIENGILLLPSEY